MKKKIPKPITLVDNGELSKNRHCIDLLDDNGLLCNPTDEKWRARLVRTMKYWSKLETSLSIQQFCIAYDITRRRFTEWKDKYPEIGEALEDMKINIGCHREIGSMTNKLNGLYAHKNIHEYDEKWLAVNKYHADLKKDEDRHGDTFVINMDKPPVSTKDELEEEHRRRDAENSME